MARELRFKVTGESSGAIVALQETQSAIKKLGSESITSVGQSKAEFSSLLAAIEKTSPELAGLSKAAFDAGLALDKAGDSKGPGQLTQRLIEAQIRVDQFAAGLEKAAASGADIGDKPTKSLQNMQAAIETLKAHLVNLEGANEAAKVKLGFIGEPGAKSLGTLAKETKAATDAIKGLEEAGSLREVSLSFNQAQFAAVSLREAIEQAERAGGKVDDEAVAALKNLDQAVDSTAAKIEKLKDARGDAAAKAKIEGDAYATLRGEVGDLGGMFDKMRETGTGATKAIGTVGTAIGVASVAITGAIQAGKQLAEGIDALSEKYAKLQQKQIDQKIRLQEQDIATRAADRGLIEHGKTIDETVANYNKFAVAQGRLSESNRKFIEGVAGLKIPPTFEDLSRQVDAIKIAFEGAYKRGDEFGNRMLVENGQILTELRQKYIDIGQAVPPEIQKLVDKLDALKTAGEAAAGGVDQAAEKVMTLAEAASQTGPSLDGMRERIMDLSKASDVAAAINAKYRDQLKETAPALNEFGRNAFDQERWDENTADIARSTQALKDQNFALQEGFDAWSTAGIAMGKFSVDVRQATKDYVETGDAALDLIEKMARANDKLGDLSVFAGSWIAELEKGNITTGEFRKKLDELSVGLPYYSALLRAAGVDAAETSAAISEMYAALNDVTFMEPAMEWWEKFGVTMQSAFFKARDAAKQLKGELEVVEVVAGRVNELISGPLGTKPQELEDGYKRPKPKNGDTR